MKVAIKASPQAQPTICEHGHTMTNTLSRSSLSCWWVLLCFLSLTRSSELYEGDSCNLPNGDPGVCKQAESCAIARQYFKNTRPTICCFNGVQVQPIICCPQLPATTAAPPAPRARLTMPADPYLRPIKVCEFYATFSNVPRRRHVLPKPVTSRASFRFVRSLDVDVSIENSGNNGSGGHNGSGESNGSGEINGSGENITTELGSDLGYRVHGGNVTDEGEFPHMAALGYGEEGNIFWLCGGSLISERFILTAAHCLASRERGVVRWARLGTNTANESNEYMQKVAVVDRYRPDEYTSRSLYHDIALLRLEHDVQFDSFVRPACLHTEFIGPEYGSCVATGWGAVNSSVDGSITLMKVNLPFQNPDVCNSTFKSLIKRGVKLSRGISEDSMLCVGDRASGKDTCQGDSGGPIQVMLASPPDMYSIVGVTSFGVAGCGEGRAPAVYTRVSFYVPWIVSIVWPEV